ncbi:TPA: hypothetical protein ACNTI0_004517 [Escherichia coli]
MVGKPVQRYYNEFWALNNINFTINKGESAGIIGRMVLAKVHYYS